MALEAAPEADEAEVVAPNSMPPWPLLPEFSPRESGILVDILTLQIFRQLVARHQLGRAEF